jgi:hypothetical protein
MLSKQNMENKQIYQIENYNIHYNLFCSNINPSLKKELGINIDENFILNTDWKPPTEYGLNNSERIIPEHYFENENKSFKEIDLFYELSKDIRNLKPLNEIQLTYIKTLPKDKIFELLQIYNLCLTNINHLMENL